jgi:hypothetical protein
MRYAFLFLCLLLVTPASAQFYYYLGGGYNGSVVENSGMNFVIDRYNNTRSWLDKEMEHITFQHGLSFSAGIVIAGLLMDINYVGRGGSSDASGNNGSRELEHSNNSWDFSFAAIVHSEEYFNLGLGLTVDIGTTFTRTKNNTQTDWTEADDLLVGSTFFTQFFFLFSKESQIGLSIRPYYQLWYLDADYSDVNKAINPQTYGNDSYDDVKGKPDNFGVVVQLVYFSSIL